MTPFQRWSIYSVLLCLSTGMMLGRIAAVDRVEYSRHSSYAAVQSPALSANDRSRWCTIRALVEPEMRVTDDDGRIIWYAIDRVQDEPSWDTIDMVKHRSPRSDTDREFLYSSKPPLLPILLAIPYAAIYYCSFGNISLETHPYTVVRIMLVVCQLVPLMLAWCLLIRRIDSLATSDVTRITAAAFVCFGTFLSTFVVTLNNHVFGFVAATIALDATLRIVCEEKRNWQLFLLAGAAAAFTVACELPAAVFAALLGVWLLRTTPRQTLIGFSIGVLLVAVPFFATNLYPHGTLKPPYAQKEWYDYTYQRGGRERVSHWNNRIGIDVGEESIATYALHTTVGHHGLFSLTPMWIITLVGLAIWLRGSSNDNDSRLRTLALIIAVTWFVVGIFYLTRTQVDRNYGGMTACLRWTLWLSALTTLPLCPALDRIIAAAEHSRRGRFMWLLVLAALVLSALSVAYPTWNPWSHPWIYNWLHFCGVKLLGN